MKTFAIAPKVLSPELKRKEPLCPYCENSLSIQSLAVIAVFKYFFALRMNSQVFRASGSKSEQSKEPKNTHSCLKFLND